MFQNQSKHIDYKQAWESQHWQEEEWGLMSQNICTEFEAPRILHLPDKCPILKAQKWMNVKA